MKAYFIRSPRTINDLWYPHLLEQEHEYKIVKSIKLSKIAYENFTTDMLADRQFIEDNAVLCSEGTVWKCLFIHERGYNDGVLVIPEMDAYVKWAAYIARKV